MLETLYMLRNNRGGFAEICLVCAALGLTKRQIDLVLQDLTNKGYRF